ncbi:UDP-galactopyranose mutase [Rubellimicrobium aerolatum]|uniref:UDP-galactopyranose mutase n=1 Tax=Rubellimicrobium aerolatum TaxID=490979 RepID=A0ABW0S933_9RHOB|nr:UDP-galactopyranose mutase [Rubellimicrobium aerolatum]MBP1804804.1 UDP-galactopyranose mutase [Rubellimicrobium aerolatum]
MPDATPFPLNDVSGPLICFSHLRWDFVLQRPQHLMGRFAKGRRVIYWEEVIPTDHDKPYYEIHVFEDDNVRAIRPRVPRGWSAQETEKALAAMLDDLLALQGGGKPVLWFYTPMMWPVARHVEADAVVYDCMDELSHFKFAPPELREREAALLGAADVVFTGGWSIWEAKKLQHDNIHPFPSSVDARHFAQARQGMAEPADLAGIPHPRLGFYGVIDERIDLSLIDHLAASRPDWHLVMVGPVVKIAEADLPRRANIHYLGGKSYAELPAYLSGWDAALMPFAINEATRFISPTKTPEYLAGGRPVVSTPIRDVVRHYGDLEGVRIADTPEAFLAACEAALALAGTPEAWRPAVDAMLADLSWDTTFKRMDRHLAEAVQMRRSRRAPDRFAAPGIRRGGSRPYDVVIAGAGFAGSIMAERLAEGSNKRVLVVDKRPHVAGNAYDLHDKAGVLIHQYGPHIFHTNSEQVVDYLSRFTAWRPYEHRVLAKVGEKLLPMPINRTTLNGLYNLNLQSDEDAAAFLAAQAEPVEDIRTSRDVVVNAVGRHLYETFFQGYTRKQWGLDPSELDKSVTSRVPTRTSLDDRYFTDTFQAMPKEGFTRMFERMLDHPNIDLALGTDFHDLKAGDLAPLTIYTGPIDAFFGHRFGPLPYRSLQFRHETLDQRRFQEVAVVNYPAQEVPFTRVTEYKYLTGQVHDRTSITYEYPSAVGDPYYPIPRPENAALFKRYEALALQRDDVIFLGRLGTYRYYNMDQVVGQALATYRRLAERMAARTAASSTAAE